MNKYNPLVSIIVPIYGVEKYIEPCIASLIKQTYSNIEIILVDDGSKDQCPMICDKYSQIDKRISVLHKKNGGLVSARKAGIQRAKGSFVQFVDGDDWISENMIAVMVESALQTNADVTMCNYFEAKNTNVKHKLQLNPGTYMGKALQEIIENNSLFSGIYRPHYNFGIEPVIWNKMFKLNIVKDRLKKIPDKISYGEDVACFFSALLHIESLHVIDQCLYFYRINPEGMSKAYSKTQTEDTIILIKYLEKQLKTNFQLYQQLKYYHISITMANLNNESKLNHLWDFRKGYKKLKKFINDTNFYEIVKHIDFSCMNKVVTSTIFLIKMRLMFLVYIVLVIKNKLSEKKAERI